MSANASKLVLVSGANGYIATEIVIVLLRAGYSVRATVRSDKTGIEWKSHIHGAERLTVVVVPDITADGAFDEAVKGVDYFIHAASPIPDASAPSIDNEKDLLIPALHGTTSALRSAIKESRIQKVIILSSVASVVDYDRSPLAGAIFDESSWNRGTYEWAKTGLPMQAYAVSKAIAEKAAWDFKEQEQPSFKLVTINPTFVLGPSSVPRGVTGTLQLVGYVLNPNADITKAPGGPHMVDVRDVADAHVRALEIAEANGKRFLISQSTTHPSDYVHILQSVSPEIKDLLAKVPEGFKNAPTYELDVSASQRILGIEYRSKEETLKDTAKWIISRNA